MDAVIIPISFIIICICILFGSKSSLIRYSKERVENLENYNSALIKLNEHLKRVVKSHSVLDKMYSDRVHELCTANEKYMSAVNKLLYIIKTKKFSHKTEYNLSSDLDELFDILWLEYGSKDPNNQKPRRYILLSEAREEREKNREANPNNANDSSD